MTLKRRKSIAIISGLLIGLAVLTEHVLNLPAAADILMILAAVLAGLDIVGRAWRSLRNRHVSIELLVSIAAVGALILGDYWEAAVVTFLFMLGGYLEARTMYRTRQALQNLLDLAPTTAIVLRDGQQVEVQFYDVQPGETVLIKPGARIPVDGEVLAGRVVVDESPITGESIPVEKSPGDLVYAGTVSQDGVLTVRATGVGADTTLARIIRRVEEAQEERAPMQRFIEQFAQWYTPAIIALSAVAFAITRDIELALTLLVIGCPGALVISTPVSVVAGIGQAARRGILVKGGEYLENAAKITVLALDKTGTVTQGKPQLTDVIVLQPALVPAGIVEQPDTIGRWSPDQAEVLRWAAIAEAGSEHPLARPILAEARALFTIPQAEDYQNTPGRGICAHYQDHSVVIGTVDLMTAQGILVSEEAEAQLAELKASGKTAVLVALDGAELGILAVSDPPRDNAAHAIKRLREVGIKQIVMLTGDDSRTAQAIARQVGIDTVYAQLLPDDKLNWIRQLQKSGQIVAMVGDGINDAPALAAANIGIAMGAAGTDVALETADIALMADDLEKIPEAMALSRATLRNIRQNVGVALITVTGLLAGVLLGEVHMAGGMFIHEISVLAVILNGMRLLRH